MKYLHVSKELHIVPDPLNHGGFKFVLYRGDGRTYHVGSNHKERQHRNGLSARGRKRRDKMIRRMEREGFL